MDGTSAAPSSSPLSPSIMSVSPRTSSRNFQHALPSTPTFQSRDQHAARSMLSRGPESHFASRDHDDDEEATPTVERDFRDFAATAEDIGNRHSHGLSWSSVTNDDVVDNLLFSLNGGTSSQAPNSGLRDQTERNEYLGSLTSTSMRPMDLVSHTMRRGTRSSSTSSDVDRTVVDSPGSKYSATSPGRRSNSSANQYPPKSSLNARFKSVRAHGIGRSSSEAHRPNNGQTEHIGGSAGRATGPETGTDNGFGAGPSINRSASWARENAYGKENTRLSIHPGSSSTFLERDRAGPAAYHGTYDADQDDDFNAAPEPIVAAGPRKLQNPSATGPVYVNPAPSLRAKSSALRKISTASAQTDVSRTTAQFSPLTPVPPEIRHQAVDFVRTSSLRGSGPPVPASSDSAEPAPSPDVRRREPSPQRERPGFFKRVFGGGSASRAAAAAVNVPPPMQVEQPPVVSKQVTSETSEPAPTATLPVPPRARSYTAAADTPHVKSDSRQMSAATASPHPPPSLNKKPSSFFRRRKKSTSEGVHSSPPPLPINTTANNVALSIKPPEPSPSISSLRKAMGLYLSADGHANLSKPEDLHRPVTSASHDTDDLDIFHHGYVAPLDNGLRPMSEQADRASTLAAGKRRPEALSVLGLSGLSQNGSWEPSRREAPSLSPRQTETERTKVSPLMAAVTLNRDFDGNGSRPSTGEKIIAAAKKRSPSEVMRDMRDFSAGTGLSLDMYADDWSASRNGKPVQRSGSDDWVVTRNDPVERPSSPRSERLILQPSPIGEEEDPLKSDDISAFDRSLGPPVIMAPLGLPSIDIDRDTSRRSSLADLRVLSAAVDENAEYRERAQKIYDGIEDDVCQADASAWMGENNTLSARTLQAYMQLFDFNGMNLLAALRTLCSKLQLRGETQQFDRIITALSARWCECNIFHGFKAQDVVHTIFYSVILLNTDLHLADIPEKMSRNAYVKNTVPTIRRVVADAAPNAFDESLKPTTSQSGRPSVPWMSDLGFSPTSPTFQIPEIQQMDGTSVDNGRTSTMNTTSAKRLSMRPGMLRSDSEATSHDVSSDGSSNALVANPWNGTLRGWETEIEAVLKSFYTSISSRPLPLQGATAADLPSAGRNLSVVNLNGTMTRTASIISRAPSDNMSYRSKQGFGPRWTNSRMNRSRQKLYPASTIGSSRTSLEDPSIWSPTQSSKYSFSKTLTSASVNSFGAYVDPFKHSIGFANALSQAIIREETTVGGGGDNDSIQMTGGLLEDDTLALEGAPWAKEGLVKHKHHLETTDRKAKERSWSDCFAVISKGKMTLFAFNTSSKSQSMGRKAGLGRAGKAASVTGTKVGGGDWMENAEQLEVFTLRQTIASTLPPPGYSKTRPHVWALSLPTGAVHLFQVGTPEIAGEFMTTANYWSARLSKEPLQGGVSNIEYGWSEHIINTAVLDRVGSPSGASMTSPPSSMQTRQMGHMHSMSIERGGRSSLQSGSLRSSMDTGFGGKVRLPGDKVQINEWQPPSQSMMASQLMEVDQLRQLTAYVTSSEEELEKHNELKTAIELAYSPRQPNFNRVMVNWQRKSDYLLREIVKFRTYIDSLTAAQKSKEAFYAKKAEGRLSPVPKNDGSAALGLRESLSTTLMKDVLPRGIHTSG